jgi:hypothetical protein
MICRIWRGWTTPANADAYESVVRGEVIPGIEAGGRPCAPAGLGEWIEPRRGRVALAKVAVDWPAPPVATGTEPAKQTRQKPDECVNAAVLARD